MVASAVNHARKEVRMIVRARWILPRKEVVVNDRLLCSSEVPQGGADLTDGALKCLFLRL
jgi:hypothetical protein